MASGDGSNRVLNLGVGVKRSSSSKSMAPLAPSSSSSSLFLSGSSSLFLDSGSMMCFEDVNGLGRSSRSFLTSFDPEDNMEDFEDYLNQGGKKRRLSIDQVQFLERSFEVENKLEPDRKVQLAKDLGLQPRQVAIWFQNRRARWKTKQMEKDYDSLQASFNSLKASYDSLAQENENLKAEVAQLTEKIALKANSLDSNQASETSNHSAAHPENPVSNSASEEQESKLPNVEWNNNKLDDFTSAKSDTFQSDSPRCYADGVYSPHLEHVDSSYMFEQDNNNSDLSTDEDDSFPKRMLPSSSASYMFPPPQHRGYPEHHPSASSSNFVSAPGDQPFWAWSF